MKKFALLAVAAAMAIIPASAMAQTPADWGGWQNQHSDNLASPNYPANFSNNGLGDSQYCLDPGTTSTHCGTSVQNGGTAVYSPIVFAGELGGGTGCGHADAGNPDNNNIVQAPTDGPGNPCATPGGLGAFYLGFACTNTDPAGAASQPAPSVPGTPIQPCRGIIGLQG